MEKFWARIRLNDEENAQELLKAFFAEEFSPKNNILIKGSKVFVEVFFDETPPAEIATIIGGYKDIDFGYGKVQDRYLEENCPVENEEDNPPTDAEEQDANQSEDFTAAAETRAEGDERQIKGQNIASDEDEVNSSQVNMDSNAVEPQENNDDFKRSKKAPDSIPKLDEIAQTSVSFDGFIDRVAQWFEFGMRTPIFYRLVHTAAKIEYSVKADVKVTWSNLLAETTGQEGFVFTTNDKIVMTRQVAKKLSEIQSNGSILSVIRLTAKYHDYDFKSNIKDKVRNILVKMGLEEKSHEEQDLILQVATGGLAIAATIGSPNAIDMHNLCRSLGAVHPDVMQMTFSTFVNDFYRANHNKEMRAKDFIMKLNEMIVTGEEEF